MPRLALCREAASGGTPNPEAGCVLAEAELVPSCTGDGSACGAERL